MQNTLKKLYILIVCNVLMYQMKYRPSFGDIFSCGNKTLQNYYSHALQNCEENEAASRSGVKS